MDNNIAFQGKFSISNKIKRKVGFRTALPKTQESKLELQFLKQTKNCSYDLEMAEVGVNDKYTKFLLKSGDEVAESSLEEFWGHPAKQTVDNLLKIYEKMVLKKCYNVRMLEIESQYQEMKKVYTVKKDFESLARLEEDVVKQRNALNLVFEKMFDQKLIG